MAAVIPMGVIGSGRTPGNSPRLRTLAPFCITPGETRKAKERDITGEFNWAGVSNFEREKVGEQNTRAHTHTRTENKTDNAQTKSSIVYKLLMLLLKKNQSNISLKGGGLWVGKEDSVVKSPCTVSKETAV